MLCFCHASKAYKIHQNIVYIYNLQSSNNLRLFSCFFFYHVFGHSCCQGDIFRSNMIYHQTQAEQLKAETWPKKILLILSAAGHRGHFCQPVPSCEHPRTKGTQQRHFFIAKLHLSIFARWHNHIPSASDELQALPGNGGCIESSREGMALQTPASASNLTPFSQESERNITELCATISSRAAARYEKEYYGW